MPGLDFAADPRPGYVEPDAAFKAGFEALLIQGKGIVALHHALAGWPAWPQYAEWLGGRFLYRPGELRGEHRLDSGYRHDVAYEAVAVADHPVLAGVPAHFPLTDELYLAEVFEDSVTHAAASQSRLRPRRLLLRRPRRREGGMHDNARLGPPAGQRPDRLDQARHQQPGRLPAARRRACRPMRIRTTAASSRTRSAGSSRRKRRRRAVLNLPDPPESRTSSTTSASPPVSTTASMAPARSSSADHIPLARSSHRGVEDARPLDHSSAYGQWGELMVEFVQQNDDRPSAFHDLFPARSGRSGVHHVALFVDDIDAAIAQFEAAGRETALHAQTGAGLAFAMIDTSADLGHMTEVYEGRHVCGFYDTVRQAARDFDGGDPLIPLSFD